MFITSLCPHANGNASRRVPECHNLKCHDLKSHFRESHVPKSTCPPVHTSPSPHSKGDFSLICYPSTQTLFEHALPKILKTEMASERVNFMLTLHYCLLESFRKMLEVFYFVLLFRMPGKCWVIKLKRFVGYRSRF